LRCSDLRRSDLCGPDLRRSRAELRGRPELRDGKELLRAQVLPRAVLQGAVPSRPLPS
jgi:hypothetical protein